MTDYSEANILATHGIKGDPFAPINGTDFLVSACLKCGSVVVAPDEISATAYALLADASEEWCCGYTIVYLRNPEHVRPTDATAVYSHTPSSAVPDLCAALLAWNRAAIASRDPRPFSAQAGRGDDIDEGALGVE